ncbi:hypothetical protein EKI60_05435 [Candidatus Saccharibacteria bacterium]|nr:MAG: hypothetical protein EKI60_05435 [Candidatus Saccharibacteria bacterium]
MSIPTFSPHVTEGLLPLNLPIEQTGPDLFAFGDVERIAEYTAFVHPLPDGTHRNANLEAAVFDIAKQRGGKHLKRQNENGAVVLDGDVVVKYCWEGPALLEAFASEVTRVGLEQLASTEAHGLKVPKIIGGVTTGHNGMLVIEHVPDHVDVRDMPMLTRDAFRAAKPTREALYARTTVLGSGGVLTESVALDDGEYNTLCPVDFEPTADQPLPDQLVRIDFGKFPEELRTIPQWQTIRAAISLGLADARRG